MHLLHKGMLPHISMEYVWQSRKIQFSLNFLTCSWLFREKLGLDTTFITFSFQLICSREMCNYLKQVCLQKKLNIYDAFCVP